MNLRNRKTQNGVVTSQLVVIVVVVIAVIVVLWLLLRDQGKDDQKNEPGLVNPISLVA
jgi:flagellar basal body-associated protein FliL